MAHGTKYRYGALAIDVDKIKEVTPEIRRFRCVVRGFGGKKDIPRKEYIIDAATNAIAAREALNKYNRNVE